MSVSVSGMIHVPYDPPSGVSDPFPVESCVHELFERRVRAAPDAVAVVSGGVDHSYAEVNRRANRIAHRIRALGVGADSLVGVLTERSVEMVAAVLGVCKAGGAFVPLDPGHPATRIREVVNGSGIDCVITQDHLRDTVTGLRTTIVDTDCGDMPEDDLQVDVSLRDLVYVIHTSGSTGAPKGVMVEHVGLANYLGWLGGELSAWDPVSSLLHSSLGFDFSFSSLLLPLVTGGRLVLADPRLPLDDLPAVVQDPGLDLVRLTPSHVDVLASALGDRSGLPGPRVFLIGGEILRAHHLATIRRLFPTSTVYNHYGPSEGVIGRCAQRLVESASFRLADYATHDPLPVGRPITNTEIYLAPSAATDHGDGVGELLIGGTGLARGYLGLPESTEQRFPAIAEGLGRVYRTGDLARLDSQGNLVVLGRSDDQVKIRGHRVEPGEIAAKITGLPGVAQAVVLRADESRVSLVAFVVPASSCSIDIDALRTLLAAQVPAHLVPHRFQLVAELPLTHNGKLDQRILLSTTGAGGGPRPSPAAVETDTGAADTLRSVQRIWGTVLGVDEVTAEDDFLDLGGDSISAMRIVAECGRIGIDLTTAAVLGAASLRESLDRAVVRSTAGPDNFAVPESAAPVALTPIQRWFTTLDLSERNLFNQGVVLTLPLDHDPGLLRAAFARVVDRHQALRLRFADHGGEWRQSEDPTASAVIEVAHWDSSAEPDGWRRLLHSADEALDIRSGPVVRALVVRDRAGSAPDKIILVAHHLVVDTISWRTMVGEIVADYHALAAGRHSVDNAPPGFLTWARAVDRLAAVGQFESQAEYWARLTGPGSGIADHLGEPGRHAEARHTEIRLGRADTAAVRALAASRGLRGDVPALAATLSALAACDGGDHVTLTLESHGRVESWVDHPISATVGWFTARFPQRFDVDRSESAADLERRAHDTLAAIPDLGAGYGMLTSHRPVEPAVSFNFLGDLHTPSAMSADGWRVLDWWHWQRDPAGVRPCALEVTGAYLDEELVIRFVSPENPLCTRIEDAVNRYLHSFAADTGTRCLTEKFV